MIPLVTKQSYVYSGLHIKCQIFLSDYNRNWIFFIFPAKYSPLQNFTKIPPTGAKAFHAEGQTDRQNDATIRFPHICESASKQEWRFMTVNIWLWLRLFRYIYRVSQEERSIFWVVIVSVILSKKLYMNMCPIPNGFRDRAIWLYGGLAWAPTIVLPSRPAAPLSEAYESVEFSKIYYKLHQLCHLNNKYRYQKQYVLVMSLYQQFCGLHSNGSI